MCFVGIDFGTTNSVVSYLKDNNSNIDVFSISIGGGTTNYIPSIIGYSNSGAVIGEEAFVDFKANKISKENYYEHFKMYLPVSEQLETLDSQYGWKNTKLPSVITMDYLKELLNAFRDKIGNISKLVVAVPGLWQKSFPNIAAETLERILVEDLKLPLLQLIPEPVSAAIYYSHTTKKYGNILLCDMGGGTYDVSLCSFAKNKAEVINHWGTNKYGIGEAGISFDKQITKILCNKIHSKDSLDEKDVIEIYKEFEKNKILKHGTASADINTKLNSLKSGTTKMEDVENASIYTFSHNRQSYEVTFGDITNGFDDIGKSIKNIMKNISKDSYDSVVITGGFGQFPLVQKAIQDGLGLNDDEWNKRFDKNFYRKQESYFAISKGATLVAANKVIIKQKYPHTIGVIHPIIDTIALTVQKQIECHIIESGHELDNKIVWAAGEWFVKQKDNKIYLTVFINQNGEVQNMYKEMICLNAPYNISDKYYKIGIRINISNIPDIYLCDSYTYKQMVNGETYIHDNVSRLQLNGLIDKLRNKNQQGRLWTIQTQ